MRFIVMFVTAVCVLFLIKLREKVKHYQKKCLANDKCYLFTSRCETTDFPTLLYTSTCEIATGPFINLKPEKGTPFGRGPCS